MRTYKAPCFVCGKLVERKQRGKWGVQVTCQSYNCKQTEQRHRGTLEAWGKLQAEIGRTLKADMDVSGLTVNQRLEFLKLCVSKEQMIREAARDERPVAAGGVAHPSDAVTGRGYDSARGRRAVE